jgi:predicted ABC-type transport system involved in lysophospholipase L1 biosynthesis ATPase subunit
LDSETSGTVLQIFVELVRECGSSLLLVTHDPSVAGAADRIVRLRDGKIAANPGEYANASGIAI